MPSRLPLTLTLTFFLALSALAQLPHLRHEDGTTRLIVDGEPFIVRGGELGNSTAGGLDSLAKCWPGLVELNLNTVVAPVYWHACEPVEGTFDWTLLDGLIEQARAHEMRLVLLWFGSWKNSMSCYAPNWVKRDLERFPRAELSSGRRLEIVSPFSAEVVAADQRAFRAFMKHLRAIDGDAHTVIMVQVENEIGMVEEPRDHSALADAAWAQEVPRVLIESLLAQEAAGTLVPEFAAFWAGQGHRTAGTWAEVFGAGPAGEEIFMAWHFARFVQAVSEEGLKEYDLPLFVNAALIRPAYEPGQYVSAGPLPHLLNLWRAGAPALDFLAPDIYFPNFEHWTGLYHRMGNPLMIPEALRSNDASVNALYAFGQHQALGFSPFGIESIEAGPRDLLRQSYDLVRQLTPLLARTVGPEATRGFLPPAPGAQRAPHRVRLNGIVMNVTYERLEAPSLADGVINEAGDRPASLRTLPAGGLVIATGPDEFIFAGIGMTVTFDSENAGELIGILEVEDGHFESGKWVRDRWLSGDQTHQGRHLRLEPGRFDLQRIRLYRY